MFFLITLLGLYSTTLNKKNTRDPFPHPFSAMCLTRIGGSRKGPWAWWQDQGLTLTMKNEGWLIKNRWRQEFNFIKHGDIANKNYATITIWESKIIKMNQMLDMTNTYGESLCKMGISRKSINLRQWTSCLKMKNNPSSVVGSFVSLVKPCDSYWENAWWVTNTTVGEP